ncbi:hypothetical protein B0H63DRAFT_474897 [Podospora didyma]|uniref:Zn(2)-C6 fungal-type domain-containing protein n=1 Tax=Podospora didyma TaxID=330526 RepID=A0AAE0TVI8_9PEZI|nr:hypothetical protein B0H63DRAFT_474897 [Podospora didyma]
MPRAARKPQGPPFESSKRLPVNPRRKKVEPDQRKRVQTACNRCNIKRIKCSGHDPCQQCLNAKGEGEVCQYPVSAPKKTVLEAEWIEVHEKVANLMERLARYESFTEEERAAYGRRLSHDEQDERVPNPYQEDQSVARQQHEHPNLVPLVPYPPAIDPALTAQSEMEVDDNLVRTEGQLLADEDGNMRYMGETSGATYLDKIRVFISASQILATGTSGSSLNKTGHYQTFDSRPMRLPKVDANVSPPRAQARGMLGELSTFIQDGSGHFASGGILFWPLGTSMPAARRSSRRDAAPYHVAFAFHTLLSLTEHGSQVDGQLGEEHFARARELLQNPLDGQLQTSNDIAALALSALYLVENNRRDAACIAISNAMHVSVVQGVHRGLLTDEKSRRTFWTVYILDRWLSCVLGRPPTIPDDSIHVDEPRYCPGLPSPVGLQAHVELSRISNKIVVNSYSRLQGNCDYVDTAIDLLHEWKAKLSPVLQMGEPTVPTLGDLEDLSSYEPLRTPGDDDRARYSLHMAYNQLVILALRPALLAAVKKVVLDGVWRREWNIQSHPFYARIDDCSKAARSNLKLACWIRVISPKQKLLLADLHHIFNAALVLLLHQIGFSNMRTMDSRLIDFAITVFEKEAGTGNGNSIECIRILKDMRVLVRRLRARLYRDDPDQTGPLEVEKYLIYPGQNNFEAGALMGDRVDELNKFLSQLKGFGSEQNGEGKLVKELRSWWTPDDEEGHYGIDII